MFNRTTPLRLTRARRPKGRRAVDPCAGARAPFAPPFRCRDVRASTIADLLVKAARLLELRAWCTEPQPHPLTVASVIRETASAYTAAAAEHELAFFLGPDWNDALRIRDPIDAETAGHFLHAFADTIRAFGVSVWTAEQVAEAEAELSAATGGER
jgi:hypothetical protein